MRQRFTRGLKGASVFTLLALVLAGCTQQSMLGWMPTERGLTNQVDRVIDLWVVSWVVLLDTNHRSMTRSTWLVNPRSVGIQPSIDC